MGQHGAMGQHESTDEQTRTQSIQNRTAPVAHVFAVLDANSVGQDEGQSGQNNTVFAIHDIETFETSLIANSVEQTNGNHRSFVVHVIITFEIDSIERDQTQQILKYVTFLF